MILQAPGSYHFFTAYRTKDGRWNTAIPTAPGVTNTFDFSVTAGDPCGQYYGKGYCTDYIERRTGKRQRGDAKTWVGNIQKEEVRQGNVAIFDTGKWGHVAYVEKVNYGKDVKGKYKPISVEVSEMNWPGPLDECARGKNFNIKTTGRIVSIYQVSRFWRP